MLKKVRYALEGLGFTAIYSVYGLLSPQAAANLGSFILRSLGPLLPVAKRARANILKAFPNTTAQNLRHILQGMWDHLGRLSGEFAHGLFFRKPENHQLIQIVGAEIIARLQASGGPIVFATGHFGSWQMIPIALERLQLPVFQLYRAANNPVSDRILQKAQRDSGVTEAIRKGPHGLKNLTKRLKAGQSVLIFFDQHIQEGRPLPFFDHPARTGPAVAHLALRFNCPLVPVSCQRLGKTNHFRVTFEEPLPLDHATEETLLRQLNKRLEDWIQQAPHQWMWVHHRWKA